MFIMSLNLSYFNNMKTLLVSTLFVLIIFFTMSWYGIDSLYIESLLPYLILAMLCLGILAIILWLTGATHKPIIILKKQSDGTAFYDRWWVWLLIAIGATLVIFPLGGGLAIFILGNTKDWLHDTHWKYVFMIPWSSLFIIWITWKFFQGLILGGKKK